MAAFSVWSDPLMPLDITQKPLTLKGRNLITKVTEFIDCNWSDGMPACWNKCSRRRTFNTSIDQVYSHSHGYG